uniref:Mitochondrial carrier protein n=1 Tax=Corethron hystrix TaxID=216773 RepID=A0A7S1BE39_9STRA|mmetsp:Transcript_24322/g.55429  ORF Transcript_24322/g.55429 Transcript_24322/m.55429 type:complete len:243 (+) Transcript_24322:441-1169(+)
MSSVFPYAGIQFMTFDFIKKRFVSEGHKNHMTGAESFFAGSTAGVISVICTYPLDLTRAQLAVIKKKKTGHNRGFLNVIVNTYRERGIAGLYRGISPTLLGILPYAGVAFAINEQTKKKITFANDRAPTLVEKLLSGGLSGLVAQSITYPLEITRRRMQTVGLVSCKEGSSLLKQPGSVGVSYHAKEIPLSMYDTITVLLREQGWRGLFKGLSMNWVKGPISFSISFTAYDYWKTVFSIEEQ